MAVTLAIFAAAQVLVPNFVRPNLISPVHVTVPFNANAANEVSVSVGGSNNNTMHLLGSFSPPGAWILSNQTVTPAGKVFTGPAPAACLGNSAAGVQRLAQ